MRGAARSLVCSLCSPQASAPLFTHPHHIPGLDELAHLPQRHRAVEHALLAALRAAHAAGDVGADVVEGANGAPKPSALQRAVPAELVAAGQACGGRGWRRGQALN